MGTREASAAPAASFMTAHSEEILPLPEQRGATGPDNALIGNRPYLHYRRAETISFRPEVILAAAGQSDLTQLKKPGPFRNGVWCMQETYSGLSARTGWAAERGIPSAAANRVAKHDGAGSWPGPFAKVSLIQPSVSPDTY